MPVTSSGMKLPRKLRLHPIKRTFQRMQEFNGTENSPGSIAEPTPWSPSQKTLYDLKHFGVSIDEILIDAKYYGGSEPNPTDDGFLSFCYGTRCIDKPLLPIDWAVPPQFIKILQKEGIPPNVIEHFRIKFVLNTRKQGSIIVTPGPAFVKYCVKSCGRERIGPLSQMHYLQLQLEGLSKNDIYKSIEIINKECKQLDGVFGLPEDKIMSLIRGLAT